MPWLIRYGIALVAVAIATSVRQVFQIVNEETRAPVISPIERVLAEGRGGVLEVKSELGVGSTFCFTWPKQSA